MDIVIVIMDDGYCNVCCLLLVNCLSMTVLSKREIEKLIGNLDCIL